MNEHVWDGFVDEMEKLGARAYMKVLRRTAQTKGVDSMRQQAGRFSKKMGVDPDVLSRPFKGVGSRGPVPGSPSPTPSHVWGRHLKKVKGGRTAPENVPQVGGRTLGTRGRVHDVRRLSTQAAAPTGGRRVQIRRHEVAPGDKYRRTAPGAWKGRDARVQPNLP